MWEPFQSRVSEHHQRVVQSLSHLLHPQGDATARAMQIIQQLRAENESLYQEAAPHVNCLSAYSSDNITTSTSLLELAQQYQDMYRVPANLLKSGHTVIEKLYATSPAAGSVRKEPLRVSSGEPVACPRPPSCW